MTPEQLNALPYRPCVGIVLIKDGLVFSAKRIDTPGDAWQMPQGGMDKGETPKQAGLRELYEETGVSDDLVKKLGKTEDWLFYDLPDHLLGKAWGGKYRGQKQKWFAFQFNGTDDAINIATEHPEFSEWAWKPANEVLEHIVPFKRHIYEAVFTEFRAFLK
ncbi:RNA pyrophosphohydrolase [Thioclava sp. SK-1]|uniref:RNA pyrophosphohydrolase n=1 Tax=Thioclava sp. SK-1 TaxID=1889770 RepID=UPI000824CE2B|nr:RNA pyrophosphohydrolase [Thioclava sp. SK-1]OCX65323.1 RNA pyrophosphohydrolase [Thioclava sp. SK-1]